MKWYDKQKKSFAQQLSNTTEKKLPSQSLDDSTVTEEATSNLPLEETNQAVNTDLVGSSTVTQQSAFKEKEDLEENETIQEVIQAPLAPQSQPIAQMTILGNAIIQGNLISENDISLSGEVIGDVQCSKSLIIYGKVNGNIQCNECIIAENGFVKGSIIASTFESNGTLVGNATIKATSILSSTSKMRGDLKSNDVEIQKGAYLSGILTITKDLTF